MKRPVPVTAFALAACLALPGVGTAKALSSVVVCGTSGCASFADDATVRAFTSVHDRVDPASHLYFRVRLTVDGIGGRSDSWTVRYEPKANAVRVAGDRGGPWRKLATRPPAEFFDRIVPLGPLGAIPASKVRATGTPSVEAAAFPTRSSATRFPWLAFSLGAAAVVLLGAATLGRRWRKHLVGVKNQAPMSGGWARAPLDASERFLPRRAPLVARRFRWR